MAIKVCMKIQTKISFDCFAATVGRKEMLDGRLLLCVILQRICQFLWCAGGFQSKLLRTLALVHS
jgi:hypothetical protein